MKKFIIILLAVAALGIAGCEKWLDVNHNPNDATNATPDLVLPGVLTNWLSDVQSLNTTAGGWMGYWYHAGGWSGWYSEKKYDISTNYVNLFGYYTGQLTDTKYIRTNSGTNVVYPAITNVVDAWYYSRLVDVYGDVPYSEACSPEITFTPKYDDGQEIYLSLVHRLNVSIAAFDSAVNGKNASANPIYAFKNSVDVIYAGDFTKWKKFANTLKLRLVMRMSNTKTIANWKTEMDSTLAHGFITATVTGNPGYSVSSGKTNPWYSSYGYSYNNTLASANTQYCLNAYVNKKLILLADPRLLKYFWAPSGAVPAGTLIATQFGTDGDLVVQPSVVKAGNYTHMFIANDYTGPTGSPLVNNGSGHLDPSRLFLLSESLFLQSEAAVRGIITSGVAADVAYTNGITASLASSKVIAADQVAYQASPNVLWSAAWTTNEKIMHIINQKWIANYFLNHFESYNDYRRTGYPNPIHPGYVNDPTDVNFEMLSYYPSGIIRRQIPRIFPFPQAEFDINKTQVQAAVDKGVAKYGVTFTNTSWPFDARVFWDTAPKTITY
jgi:hypothetical protein